MSPATRMVRVSDANSGSTSNNDFDHLSGMIISCASRIDPPSVQKMMIDKRDVLATVEAKKDELDVLVSLGAGDIENLAPQITEILTSAL